MSNDIRKTFILNTAANFFSKDPSEFERYESDKNLSKFLDDLSVLTLVINYHKDIIFTTKVMILLFNKLIALF